MKDMKNLFKENGFIINPYVLKNIKNLNLTLNEFLLILYFINIKDILDLENIEKIIGLNPEEILNTYSDLINKGIINIIVTKENGKVNESISLDMFYDKLIMSNKEEKKDIDIFECFENEFGRSLSPIEYETINNWLNNGVSEDIIKSALKEAVINGVSNLRYIDKIIYEWTKKGNRPKESEEEYKPLFDYNWLDGEDYE